MSWLGDVDDAFDVEGVEGRLRQRPNPKANRPRTKQRPTHERAEAARVLSVDRGRFRVLIDEGEPEERELTATKARELGRTSIVTGDRARLVGDTSGAPGTLARIVRVDERSTLLRRSADDTDAIERVIVANADQMLIVVAAANPEPRARLIDRYLVAAYDAGIEPLIVITKTDVAPPDAVRAMVAGLDVPVLCSSERDVPVLELARALSGKTTVAVGHSGVGKSTLVNALAPESNRETGHVNEVTGRGRHTSSSSFSVRVRATAPDGEELSGWIIDTPGVRSFGLGHVSIDSVLRAFGDLDALAEQCPRGCEHLPGSPECGIDALAHDGAAPAAERHRADSVQRLLETLHSAER